MEANNTLQLIQAAKQAILQGNKPLARDLAEQALAANPDNVSALLIMAGVSEPQASLAYLHKVQALDPGNQTAEQAYAWANLSLRKSAAASWTPEATTRIKPVTTPVVPAVVKRKSWAVPAFLAAAALVAFLLWSAGLITIRPAAGSQFMILPQGEKIQLGASLATPSPETAAEPTAKATEPGIATAPTVSATPVIAPTPTEAQTDTPVPSPTPVPPTSTPAPTATPEPTPTPDNIDPESGLPIIQITPIAYLTEEAPPVEETEEWVPAYNPAPAEPLGEKWIDIDLSQQVLTAYEGDTAINTFWVSTGLPDTPTVTGQYRVYIKLVYTDMRGPGYYLPDVPYTMYFYQGYGIHGTYWHSNFGTPMSHGCVNMETGAAGWLFDWAYVGILVNIHY